MKAFIERFENALQCRAAFERAYKHGLIAVESGAYEVVVRLANKSRAQEEHYHALIGDIARQYRHFGQSWEDEDMKRLLVDAFKHETKNDPINYPGFDKLWAAMGDLRLVPAIGRDGFVALGDQTRKFPKRLACGFITWLYSFMHQNGVHCTDPKYAQEREAA